MVLYLIGLGLGNVKDITVRGLEIIQSCQNIYLEAYTSTLCYGLETKELEDFYGRKIIPADRDLVESQVVSL